MPSEQATPRHDRHSGPPQSMPVSAPFCTPSSQVGSGAPPLPPPPPSATPPPPPPPSPPAESPPRPPLPPLLCDELATLVALDELAEPPPGSSIRSTSSMPRSAPHEAEA